jgi:hypothetical protein
MKVARVNSYRLPILTGPGGLGGADQSLPADVTAGDLTTMFVPVMTEVDTDVWSVVVTGDGDAVMTEVPL